MVGDREGWFIVYVKYSLIHTIQLMVFPKTYCRSVMVLLRLNWVSPESSNCQIEELGYAFSICKPVLVEFRKSIPRRCLDP